MHTLNKFNNIVNFYFILINTIRYKTSPKQYVAYCNTTISGMTE